MPDLPSGAVTFLFTDIEGSTRLVRQLRGQYAGILAEHQRLLRTAFAAHGGHEIDTQGDAFFYAFGSAHQAVAAAVEGQRALAGFPWPQGAAVKVRIGIHTGQAVPANGRYTGLAVHRTARICAAGHGGQVLVSQATQSMIEDDEEDLAVELRDLGEQRLKDIDRPVRLYQVAAAGLDESFPPLREHEGPDDVRPPLTPAYRRPVFIAAAIVIAVAAGGAVVLATRSGGSGNAGAATSAVPDSIAIVDPKTNAIAGDVPIPGAPSLIAAGKNLLWVASEASRTISSISMATQKVTHVVSPNATPNALAADGNAVWLLDGTRRLLLKIDPTYGAVTARIPLPPAPPSPATNRRPSNFGLAVGDGSLWVTDGSARLLQVDPGSKRIRGVDLDNPVNDVAVGAGKVWAISGQAASVYEVDARTRAAKSPIRIVNNRGATAPYPLAVAVGEDSVWVVNGNTQTVTKIDPEQGGVTDTTALGIGSNPNDIAAGAGAVWVANGGDGTLARIDSGSGTAASIPVGSRPAGVAVGDGRVWVTVQPGFRANVALPRQLVAARSGAGPDPLPAALCSPIEYSGKGQPRYLIASDLPLQGQASLAETLQQGDAIRYILAQHGFKAGPYTVGYQSCDDSITQTGVYDRAKCRTNAEAYAADRSVIAVVGGYNSGCVQEQLAVMNAAPGGPVAMISGNATYVGLTHASPGTAPGEPEKYYPRHVRNFVRVVAADDVQGAADAVLAKRLHVKKLYVLHDAEAYGFGIAANVRQAAAKLAIRSVGFEPWQPHAREYSALARKVQRSGADAVFLGGSIDASNGAVLVKNLRAELGPRVHILTPDGFTPIAAFAKLAGPAAEGVTVSFPAAPPEELEGQGRTFVSEFRKAVGRPVEAYSVAWAQATEVLLAAIASSDGSRASVSRQLLRTRVADGILGSFSIDHNGDTTAGAVTIYKIVDGAPRVISVIRPPARLVR